MPMHILLEAPIGLGPVLIFLAVLLHLDSYKLVSLREVVQCILAGLVLGGASYFVNGRAIGALHYSFATYSRFAAPLAEEFLKSAFIIFLFARNRIGFMIDAAIAGFAVGAGFSLFENIYYLYVFPGAPIGVWVIRGFGTAIMHGGATAIFGVMAQSLTERRATVNPLLLLPGLALAIVLHGVYNYFQSTPAIAGALMVLILPMILLFVFAKSEHKVHTWLISDYESHEHLLDEIRNGEFTHSEAGRFILTLSNKFDSDVVADLFTYIRLHTELVMRAERISLAREKGEELSGGNEAHEAHEAFAKLHALEDKIGTTAMLAIWPHLHFSRKELWELSELEDRVRHA
jgi:RsiW-degrading membrane proteinase PrsW (M82 family)